MSPVSQRSVPTEIRVALVRRGAKDADMASAIGMSKTSLSRRMTGEMDFRLSELRAIAAYLEVPLERLLGEVSA